MRVALPLGLPFLDRTGDLTQQGLDEAAFSIHESLRRQVRWIDDDVAGLAVQRKVTSVVICRDDPSQPDRRSNVVPERDPNPVHDDVDVNPRLIVIKPTGHDPVERDRGRELSSKRLAVAFRE